MLWKGFVFERRGTSKSLKKHGLRLTETDAQLISELQALHGTGVDLGRPLSRRVPFSRNSLKLEIHCGIPGEESTLVSA